MMHEYVGGPSSREERTGLNRERTGDTLAPTYSPPVTEPAEPTLDRLRAGDLDGAWSIFVDRYRRLIFAQIRRATTEPDDVMDIFAHVCERLRENDLARLKRFAFDPAPRASFATWLVAVLRNL